MHYLYKTIVSAPFKTDEKTIDSLDPEITEKIYKEIEKLNVFTTEKKDK